MKLQLSIIIPTLNAGLGLKTSLNAILQQQTVPSFEVLVVSQWPHSELESELKAWDKRFKYLCSGQKGINVARNLGLKEAQGEIVLFLDDETWFDDRLFLKKHVDAHQKYPNVIAIGGIYRPKIDASSFELAYYVANAWRVAQGKIDFTRTTRLPSGNMSFKAFPLQTSFQFDEAVGVGASTQSLTDRLFASGLEMQITEKLAVESRPRFGIFGLIYRAVNQGRSIAAYSATAKNMTWKFSGAGMTRQRYLQANSIKLTRGLRFALWLYDFAFAAGTHFSNTRNTAATATVPFVIGSLLKEAVIRVKGLPFTPSATGLFLTLRTQLAKEQN